MLASNSMNLNNAVFALIAFFGSTLTRTNTYFHLICSRVTYRHAITHLKCSRPPTVKTYSIRTMCKMLNSNLTISAQLAYTVW